MSNNDMKMKKKQFCNRQIFGGIYCENWFQCIKNAHSKLQTNTLKQNVNNLAVQRE